MKTLVCALLLAAAPGVARAGSPVLVAPTGQYLGQLNGNRYDPDSVANPYGRVGNPSSADSVTNPYGTGGARVYGDD